MDTIVIILYKRPDYTKQVLEALAAQPEISKYHCHFQIDGQYAEVVDLALNFSASYSKTININCRNAGCSMNVYLGIENGFSMSDFAIIVEDDVVPAHDCLKYIEWAKNKNFLGANYRTISCYHKFEDCPPEKYNTVHAMPRWCGWLWATNKYHWDQAKKVWDWHTQKSWDIMIAENYFWQRPTIMPYLSRVRNIGSQNGTYVHSEEQHRNEVWVEKWANSVPRGTSDFIFQDETPENELIMWDESKKYLYADAPTQFYNK